MLIVSSDFSALNARERLEYLGTAAAQLWQPIEARPAPQTNWHTPNLPRFWRKSYRRGCVSHRTFACVRVCPCRGDGGSEAYDPSVSTPHPEGILQLAELRGREERTHKTAALRQWLYAAAEEYAFKRLAEGRLTLSQTAELLDLSVYDVQQKARERRIQLGATADNTARPSRRGVNCAPDATGQ